MSYRRLAAALGRREPPHPAERAPRAAVKIRWLAPIDHADVLAIESASFLRPTDERTLCETLRQRDCLGLVACRAEPYDHPQYSPVLGFTIYQARGDWLHVLDLAVDPAWRRRGVGSALAAHVAARLAAGRITRAELLMPESLLAGLQFWKSRGYVATELIRGHYGADDGIRLEYRLPADTGCERAR